GVTFIGTTIGMAPLEGMCSAENSGGVSMDHSELPIGAAATMAHEIGHNFGISHDADGCCVEATASQGGCIMAPECTNPCCNPQNCTLKAGAECAHGECCHSCKLKTAGILCRQPAGSCDLPEYCTGASPYCPSNVYLLDGSTCSHGGEYCYNGMCMTHHQQCVQLWGPGAWPAPDACFQDVNRAGDMYGNCGKDRQGNYVKCAMRDAKCGKIQCQSSAAKPKGTNTISMDTTIRFNGQEIKCRGTLVYATKDDEGDLSDPGLVMTGTKCGDGLVCKDQRCQNASFFEQDKCISKCHSHGVCNSNHNCHCDAGWAPPFCEKPGLGGSVDSGPVQQDHYEAILITLLVIFLLLVPSLLLGLYTCYRRESSLLNKWVKDLRKRQKTGRNGIVRQKTTQGHSNSGFTLQDISSTNKKKSSTTSQVARGNSSLKPNPPQGGPHPINVVRPLRPSCGPSAPFQRDPKPSRPPPPPFQGSPAMPPKAGSGGPAKLPPPKKPLPSAPVRPPPVNPQQRPPYRPLPKTLLAKDVAPAPSPALLVMVPPTNAKPAGTRALNHLSRPLKMALGWTKPPSDPGSRELSGTPPSGPERAGLNAQPNSHDLGTRPNTEQ
ncbi:disintegrin and metalloproteinase domain-containing protein 19-like, partial [Protobothrops mucrosquamatus]|uniref:disintegrin and metalloproteinase domain-containing protein 19-like n=1 Tax=Protobothrops mucrosquamatus TaxID=103944 RepID=UPI000775CF56